MTNLRFPFQRRCATVALLIHKGPVLNVGCAEDPGQIKHLNPDRVLNCDLWNHRDPDVEAGPEPIVDVVFDVALDHWPFDTRECALVILGDLLEHLKVQEIRACLAEARRVSQRLCVTVPRDDRAPVSDETADQGRRGGLHRTVVTEALLRDLMAETGWEVSDLAKVDYEFVPEGYFVQAT